MRPVLVIRRICALAFAGCTVSAVASSSAFAMSLAPAIPLQIAPVGGAKVTTVGSAFDVATGFRVACPADASSAGCKINTVMTAIVGAPTPRLVVVGRGTTTVPAASGARIKVRLNAAGAAELRRSGQFRGGLEIGATAHGSSASSGVEMTYAREQKVTLPQVVVSQPTALRAVKLLPGQRLVIRLPENTTTRYEWRITPLAPTASLRRTSMRIIPDPCSEGMVGCSSTRIVTYVSRKAGAAVITAGLYDKDDAATPVTRFSLSVASNGTPQPLPRIITARANGTTLMLGYEERFTVRLEGASPSTGYGWRVITDKAAKLKPFAHATITADCHRDTTGCPQVDEFSYVSPAAEAVLKLGLYAPGSSTPSKRFTLKVYSPTLPYWG